MLNTQTMRLLCKWTFFLLSSLLFFVGCSPKTLTVEYSLTFSQEDSLYVQWYPEGSNSPMETGLPDVSEISTTLGSRGVLLFMEIEVDKDIAAEMPPSTQMDSLKVFSVKDGQSTLIYSGISDEDWTVSTPEKSRYVYYLDL